MRKKNTNFILPTKLLSILGITILLIWNPPLTSQPPLQLPEYSSSYNIGDLSNLSIIIDQQGKEDQNNTQKHIYHLLFQNIQNNDIIFYDIHNHPILLRYRKDQWDLKSNRYVKKLIPGRLYKVTFSNITRKSKRSSNAFKPSEKQYFFYGKLVEVKEIHLEHNIW